MPYRLAIFDFDGTLADSLPWFTGVFNEVADRYRFRRASADELDALRGLDARQLLRHFRLPLWKVPLVASHMRRLAARDAATIRPFPDTGPMLETLSARGVALGVVSSNDEANVRTVLGATLAGRVRFYGCGASLFGKARKLRAVVRRAGVAPGEAVYVGDEARDVDAARAAGVASAVVAWGYADFDALRARTPTLAFRDFDGLVRGVAG